MKLDPRPATRHRALAQFRNVQRDRVRTHKQSLLVLLQPLTKWIGASACAPPQAFTTSAGFAAQISMPLLIVQLQSTFGGSNSPTAGAWRLERHHPPPSRPG
jgi:hypothetical protein